MMRRMEVAMLWILMLVGCGPEVPEDPHAACMAMWEEICVCSDGAGASCDDRSDLCNDYIATYPDNIWECLIEEANKCPASIAVDYDIQGIFATCQE